MGLSLNKANKRQPLTGSAGKSILHIAHTRTHTHHILWPIPGLSFGMEMAKEVPSVNLRKTINFRPASNIKGENLFQSF